MGLLIGLIGFFKSSLYIKGNGYGSPGDFGAFLGGQICVTMGASQEFPALFLAPIQRRPQLIRELMGVLRVVANHKIKQRLFRQNGNNWW